MDGSSKLGGFYSSPMEQPGLKSLGLNFSSLSSKNHASAFRAVKL